MRFVLFASQEAWRSRLIKQRTTTSGTVQHPALPRTRKQVLTQFRLLGLMWKSWVVTNHSGCFLPSRKGRRTRWFSLTPLSPSTPCWSCYERVWIWLDRMGKGSLFTVLRRALFPRQWIVGAEKGNQSNVTSDGLVSGWWITTTKCLWITDWNRVSL